MRIHNVKMGDWVNLASLDFPDHDASPLGFIRNTKTCRVLARKPRGRDPRVVLALRNTNREIIEIAVDELVLRTFVGPPPTVNYATIHLNGNPIDSNVENLRWSTVAEKLELKKAKYDDPEYIKSITLEGEIWKQCTNSGFPKYLASSVGRIYSLNIGQLLTGTNRPEGYITVNITNEAISSRVLVHRLVCHEFHGLPPSELHTVDHINRIRDDNRAENLRWADKSQQRLNTEDPIRIIRKVVSIENGQITKEYTKEEALKVLSRTAATFNRGLYVDNILWIYYDSLPIEGEVWLPIIITGNQRYVSNMGRVMFDNGRKTYGHENCQGYKILGTDIAQCPVHRLVATAFIRAINQGEVVNHKNGIKYDNRIENLEIVTQQANMLHSTYLGRSDNKPVAQYNLNGILANTFVSVREASRLTNIDRSSIGQCAHNILNTSGGFIWRFIE